MIDIKELRIGAHYYNGAWTGMPIGRVTSIDGTVRNPDDTRVVLFYDMPYDKDSDPYEGAMLHDLEPIPLTAELLEELGFEKEHEYGEISFWGKDNLYMRIRGERMELGVDCERTMCVYNIQYLHELEAFVYLTTKQELIKEE